MSDEGLGMNVSSVATAYIHIDDELSGVDGPTIWSRTQLLYGPCSPPEDCRGGSIEGNSGSLQRPSGSELDKENRESSVDKVSVTEQSDDEESEDGMSMKR
jgi:hypothetical protein